MEQFPVLHIQNQPESSHNSTFRDICYSFTKLQTEMLLNLWLVFHTLSLTDWDMNLVKLFIFQIFFISWVLQLLLEGYLGLFHGDGFFYWRENGIRNFKKSLLTSSSFWKCFLCFVSERRNSNLKTGINAGLCLTLYIQQVCYRRRTVCWLELCV